MTPPAPRRSRLALLRPALLGGLAVPALAASGGADDMGTQVHLATTAVMGAPPPIFMVVLGAALVGAALVRRSARIASTNASGPAAAATSAG